MDYQFEKFCHAAQLTEEIKTSSIVASLDVVYTSGNSTVVSFLDSLSENEEEILQNLVNEHTPIYPETPVLTQPVSILSQPPVSVLSIPSFSAKTLTLSNGTVKKIFARNTGFRQELTSGTNTISYSLTYQWCKIIGVEVVGAETGDYCDFEVYDNSLGTYSGYPNLKLNQFAYTVNIPKDYYIRLSQFDADIYQGMVIKVTYYSISNKTVGINLIMNEIKD